MSAVVGQLSLPSLQGRLIKFQPIWLGFTGVDILDCIYSLVVPRACSFSGYWDKDVTLLGLHI